MLNSTTSNRWVSNRWVLIRGRRWVPKILKEIRMTEMRMCTLELTKWREVSHTQRYPTDSRRNPDLAREVTAQEQPSLRCTTLGFSTPQVARPACSTISRALTLVTSLAAKCVGVQSSGRNARRYLWHAIQNIILAACIRIEYIAMCSAYRADAVELQPSISLSMRI